MKILHIPRSFLFVVALAVAAPPAAADDAAAGESEWLEWQRSELYFGLGRPNERNVSDEEWSNFLLHVVTPAFPSGFSVLSTYGQWQNRETGEVGREESRVLILLHGGSEEELERIEEVRQHYIQKYNQQSVIHSIQPARVRF